MPANHIIITFLSLAHAADDELAVVDEEIVVQAEGSGVDPSASSASVTVLEVGAHLSAADDVASVLQTASGVGVRRLGGLGDLSTVSIRGANARQTRIFVDGVPLNPHGSSSVNLSELPLEAFERLTVYRGNVPVRFGAAPLGGVVDLSTGTAAATVGSVSYGAFDTLRSTGLVRRSGEISRVPADVLAFGNVFATEGDFPYFSNNGTVYNLFDDALPDRANNDKAQLSTVVRAGIGRNNRVSVGHVWLSRQEGVPGHINSPASEARLRTRSSLASLEATQRTGAFSLSQRLWMQHRQETFDDRAGEVGLGEQFLTTRTNTVGLHADGSWAAGAWGAPSAVVSLRRDALRQVNLVADTLSSRPRRWVGTAAASVALWTARKRITVTPTAQIDVIDNRLLGDIPFESSPVAPAGEDVALVVTPRLGMLARVSPVVVVKANAGQFFRAPDFLEMFGDRGGVIGNPELRPERGTQVDAGLRAAEEGDALSWGADVTVFSSFVRDQIAFVQNSQATSVPVNIGRARTLGTEAALSLRVPWVEAQLNGTWLRAINDSPQADVQGKRLPRVAEWEVSERVALVRGPFRVGHTFSFTAGNFWDAANVFEAPPRPIHGAFLRVATDTVALELSLLNLFDRRVTLVDRNPLNDDDNTLAVQPLNDFFGYPLPGRAWMVTLSWKEPKKQQEKTT